MHVSVDVLLFMTGLEAQGHMFWYALQFKALYRFMIEKIEHLGDYNSEVDVLLSYH